MAIPNLRKPHIGRKIERLRELKGMKQEALASALGVSQQTISRIESSENVEEEKLRQIAEALGVTVEAIVNFNEDATVSNINNTYNNQDSSINSIFYYQMANSEEIKELYERLITEKDKKIELLEELLAQYRNSKKS